MMSVGDESHLLGARGESCGGRYGSLVENDDLSNISSSSSIMLPGNGSYHHRDSNSKCHSRSSSNTSSSHSSLLDDEDNDYTLMSQNAYQRQPLISSHISTSGKVTDGYHHNDLPHKNNSEVSITMPTPHRDKPRFPKERKKTLVAMIFLFFNFILATTSLALTHERVPEQPPLPDVTLDSINIQEWGLDVSEILIIVFVYSCFIVVMFHKHSWIIFRRIFLLMGLLYFYRSITMYVTVLPVANPNYFCSPKANTTSVVLVLKRVAQLLSGFGLSINGQHTFCGDYIYSGHTMMLVLCYLIVQEYTPRRWWPIHWLFGLASMVGVVMVLIARGHYTVDCVIAYYITTRLWYMYHTMANNHSLKESGPHNFFGRLWWYRMFLYFECNVQGTIPRNYEWPLPWPRRWRVKKSERTS
ncbi:unnamed protein product [Meganyctiphanes norvegica]|uniref:Sphingomyelin synthase-like domain-containing protein n=1 Tax=Meganyctiphanes norvegica TaxID=48144 RepID=A0AAV2RUF3_MEGNR